VTALAERSATADLRVFAAPSYYVQGPGAIDHLGAYVPGEASRSGGAAVLIDRTLFHSLSSRVLRALSDASVPATVIACSGEVTADRIATLAEQARTLGPAVVVAVGGGKTLDMGKGVAVALGLRILTVPTIASNDGPTSRIIATYDDHHRLVGTPQMAENPEVVLVDTELVSQAPARFLRSGIGDALAKRFEAAACRAASGLTPNGTRPLELAWYVAEACHATLLRDASAALQSAEQHEVSPALERVVEAVILMSGLAFENGGLSLAHSLTRGLMRLKGAQDQLHGFQVAYGLLVQLAHEGDDAAFSEVGAFCTAAGLPRSLANLGATPGPDAYDVVATATLLAPHMANCVPSPDAASLVAAMKAVEQSAS
jgi:glycerol dehydrogenase